MDWDVDLTTIKRIKVYLKGSYSKIKRDGGSILK
jgi:hypothetical protein